MNEEETFIALCRADFATFVQRAYYELYPAAKLVWNWHLDLIVDHLTAMQRGEVRRELVIVPPRSLKSFICSVAWPAFLLGHDPSLKIIAVSYAQPLADDLARLCLDLMSSDWYRTVFKTRLTRGRQPIDNIRTTQRGHRIATSIGGTLTGRGADIVIIDDPMKAEDAQSPAMRANVLNWFQNTLPSRTDDKATGRVLVVMQRLHQEDPASFLMDRGWPALVLPAIAPDDLAFTYRTVLGVIAWRWGKGEPLQAVREPLALLERTRVEMGSFHFAAQYLQDPEPADGNIIKKGWLRRYDSPLPEFRTVVQSYDTASKTSELNDFSVCTTWGVTTDNRYYLLDVFRGRLDHPDLVRAVVAQKNRHRADRVLIEDKVSGIGIIQDLRAQGISGIIPIEPKGDKAMRLVSVSSMFERGEVLLPTWAPWLDEYVKELITFPGKFDDQVDSTTQALLWLRYNGAEPNITTYYRERYERERQGSNKLIMIQSPDGTHRTLSLSTRVELVFTDENGIILLNEEEAMIFIREGWQKVESAD